jgi:hypothetical protein
MKDKIGEKLHKLKIYSKVRNQVFNKIGSQFCWKARDQVRDQVVQIDDQVRGQVLDRTRLQVGNQVFFQLNKKTDNER